MKAAAISECGKYRYMLERDVVHTEETGLMVRMFGQAAAPKELTVAFFGINPSTADAMLDDATVRKWNGFCARLPATRFIVGNVFSYRSTDPKALARTPFPQGPQHYTYIKAMVEGADILVPCWGGRAKVPKRLHHYIDELLAYLHRSGKPVMHFGLTDGGDPLHPLFLPYTTQLTTLEAM